MTRHLFTGNRKQRRKKKRQISFSMNCIYKDDETVRKLTIFMKHQFESSSQKTQLITYILTYIHTYIYIYKYMYICVCIDIYNNVHLQQPFNVFFCLLMFAQLQYYYQHLLPLAAVYNNDFCCCCFVCCCCCCFTA